MLAANDGFDFTGIGLLVTAVATLIAALTNTVVATRARRENRTYNETTVGMLAAEGETRRIEKIPHAKRTAKEQRHLDDAPPDDPPQGPSR